MLLRNNLQQFGIVAKLTHWVIALLILGLIWLGWYMMGLTYYDPWYHDSLTAHRALGLIVLVLALFKMVWMRVSPTPQPLPTLADWQRRASKLVHWTLIASMFVVPVSGYLISTSEGAAVPMFDWFDVPAVLSVDESTRDAAIDIHYYVAYAVLIVAFFHAAAAIKHQFVDNDGTLKRML